MGEEVVIYGDRHGDTNTIHPPPDKDGNATPLQFETNWPNSVMVLSTPPASEVEIRVYEHDPKTGVRIEDGFLVAALNREGCNRLIAGIRKHRDRVFGKDQ